MKLSIIEGEREAALSFRGASRGHEGENLLVADIGGGSTEVVLGVGGEAPKLAHSFNVGCRRMTERFYVSDPPTEPELAQARAWVQHEFKAFSNMRKTKGLQNDPYRCGGRHGNQRCFHGQEDGKYTIPLWSMALRFR